MLQKECIPPGTAHVVPVSQHLLLFPTLFPDWFLFTICSAAETEQLSN